MYFNEEELQKWAEYINSIVGNNSPKGAFIAAEKAENAEVNMAGESDELLYLIATTVFHYSKMQHIAFEDALKAISDKWEEIAEEDGYIKSGNEIIDKKTGIGYNPEEETISFPIPPKEVEEEMLAFIQNMTSEFELIKDRLKTEDDILKFFEECEFVGCMLPNAEDAENDENNKNNEEDDNKSEGIKFKYNDVIYAYFLDTPENLLSFSNAGNGIEILEEYEALNSIAIKMIKYTKENKA